MLVYLLITNIILKSISLEKSSTFFYWNPKCFGEPPIIKPTKLIKKFPSKPQAVILFGKTPFLPLYLELIVHFLKCFSKY